MKKGYTILILCLFLFSIPGIAEDDNTAGGTNYNPDGTVTTDADNAGGNTADSANVDTKPDETVTTTSSDQPVTDADTTTSATEVKDDAVIEDGTTTNIPPADDIVIGIDEDSARIGTIEPYTGEPTEVEPEPYREPEPSTAEAGEAISDPMHIGEEPKLVIAPKPRPVFIKKYQEVKRMPIAERVEAVKELKPEDFRQYQSGRLMTAVEKCKELGKDEELCKREFEKRVQLITKLQEKDLARLKKITAKKVQIMDRVERLEKIEAFKKYDKAKEFKVRVIPKPKIKKAKERFERAKENYVKVKEKYVDAKVKLKEFKAEREKCTENCEDIRNKVKLKSRDMLLQSTDKILQTLEKILSQVEASEALTDKQVIKYKDWLNKKIEEVNAIKTRVEAYNEETPRQDYNTAFKHLKTITLTTKNTIKKTTGHLINSKVGRVIIKAKYMQLKLTRVLERMAENGKDTSAIEPLIDEFNEKLDQAKAHFEKARQEWDKAKESGEFVGSAREHMEKAKTLVKEAQQILQKIVKGIVMNNGAMEFVAVEMDTAEQAVDEEVNVQ